jgi:hypothetical protein
MTINRKEVPLQTTPVIVSAKPVMKSPTDLEFVQPPPPKKIRELPRNNHREQIKKSTEPSNKRKIPGQSTVKVKRPSLIMSHSPLRIESKIKEQVVSQGLVQISENGDQKRR